MTTLVAHAQCNAAMCRYCIDSWPSPRWPRSWRLRTGSCPSSGRRGTGRCRPTRGSRWTPASPQSWTPRSSSHPPLQQPLLEALLCLSPSCRLLLSWSRNGKVEGCVSQSARSILYLSLLSIWWRFGVLLEEFLSIWPTLLSAYLILIRWFSFCSASLSFLALDTFALSCCKAVFNFPSFSLSLLCNSSFSFFSFQHSLHSRKKALFSRVH